MLNYVHIDTSSACNRQEEEGLPRIFTVVDLRFSGALLFIVVVVIIIIIIISINIFFVLVFFFLCKHLGEILDCVIEVHIRS